MTRCPKSPTEGLTALDNYDSNLIGNSLRRSIKSPPNKKGSNKVTALSK